MEAIDQWLENLEKQAARTPILFVHLGAAFPSAREALLQRSSGACSVHDYLCESVSPPGLLLINDLEELSDASGNEFGQLRQRVYEDVDNDARVILLSRRPREVFPDIPGSPLLHEAKLVPPPDHGRTAFGAELVNQGSSYKVALKEALTELGEALCASLDAALFEEQSALDQLETPVIESLVSAGLAVRNGSGTAR